MAARSIGHVSMTKRIPRRFSLRALLGATCAIAVVSALVAWSLPRPHVCHALPEFHGKSLAVTIEQFKRPTAETTFMLDRFVPEFRIELLNYYPEVVAGKAEVEIRECTWEIGNRRLTLWYHQVDDEWQVLDSLYYDANLAF
jgi:hypothetical protein